eukprot:m.72887 g.72887  ORF g.72887 m.72887 type:complete len:130 (-) comp8403_c0_seq2:1217-1606(-)
MSLKGGKACVSKRITIIASSFVYQRCHLQLLLLFCHCQRLVQVMLSTPPNSNYNRKTNNSESMYLEHGGSQCSEIVRDSERERGEPYLKRFPIFVECVISRVNKHPCELSSHKNGWVCTNTHLPLDWTS